MIAENNVPISSTLYCVMLRRFSSRFCPCIVVRLSITARQYGEVVSPSTRGYKLSRSQKSVMVQDLNCVQMRVSGCMNHYEFVLRAGTKAKSVTNNLPILSVLCLGVLFVQRKCSQLFFI
jgi:hypothetical protein